MKKDSRLERAGVSGFNKPKRTPSHPTKSHVVVAKEGDKIKTIRFGQQGKTGDKTMTKRAKSFKAIIQKLIKGENVDLDSSGLSKREWNELMIAFDLKDKLI